jgi:hypothetical protein
MVAEPVSPCAEVAKMFKVTTDWTLRGIQVPCHVPPPTEVNVSVGSEFEKATATEPALTAFAHESTT